MRIGTSLFFALVCIFIITTIPGCTAPSGNDDGTSVLTADAASELQVYGLFPNPFRDTTTLAFDLLKQKASSLRCVMYNSSGERVQEYSSTSADSTQRARFRAKVSVGDLGFTECVWDGSGFNGSLPNGVYVVELHVQFADHELVQRSLCMRKGL